MPKLRSTLFSAAAISLLQSPAAFAQESAPADLTIVTVIGTTPLLGVGQALNEIPAPAQTATGTDIDRSQALDLTAFMSRNLAGVYINNVQNNPFQPDVSYRGYTASPLLGTPHGLSIYMDGVRLNQPFWRRGKLGLDSPRRDWLADPDAGIEPAVRTEHARRRSINPDQRWPYQFRHRQPGQLRFQQSAGGRI